MKPAAVPRKLWVGIALLLLGVIVFAERFQTRTEPLERDMPSYAIVAHELLAGRKLYSDVFDQKPPAIYATYMLAEAIGGYGRAGVFLLVVLAAEVTLLGAFAAGRRLSGNPLTGLTAAAAFTLVGADLGIQANQPNTEVFMNACLIWLLALMAGAGAERSGWRPRLLAAGSLGALATLYKPIVVVAPLVVAVGLIVAQWALPVRERATRAGMLLAPIVVAWVAIALYFAAQGRFGAFYYANVTYNQAYSGDLWSNIQAGLQPQRLAPAFTLILIPLLLLCVCGAAIGARTDRRSRWIALVCYLAAVPVAIALPGQFFAHYYQLWIPPLCVGAAWGLEELAGIRAPQGRWISLAVAAVLCPLLIAYEGSYLLLSPDDASRQKYGETFVTAERIGHRINSILRPDEVFYDASEDPEFYFYSGRLPPSGVYYVGPTVQGPDTDRFTDRLLGDLKRKPPELIATLPVFKMNPRVSRWVKQYYVAYPDAHSNPWHLWMRKGGSLEARTHQGGGSETGGVNQGTAQ